MDFVKFLSSDFIYHSAPKLDLNFLHDRVLELQTQAPDTSVNVFPVDFLFDIKSPSSVVIIKNQ